MRECETCASHSFQPAEVPVVKPEVPVVKPEVSVMGQFFHEKIDNILYSVWVRMRYAIL